MSARKETLSGCFYFALFTAIVMVFVMAGIWFFAGIWEFIWAA